jgi:hypothetical protein
MVCCVPPTQRPDVVDVPPQAVLLTEEGRRGSASLVLRLRFLPRNRFLFRFRFGSGTPPLRSCPVAAPMEDIFPPSSKSHLLSKPQRALN